MYPLRRCLRHTLLSSCLVAAFTISPASAEEISQTARGHFKEGVIALQAKTPDYQAAYDSFRAAYAESPSWKILGNLGIAAMKLGRDGEAIEAFEEYLREGRPTLAPADLEQFDADLDMLRRNVVWLEFRFPKGASQLSDERQRSVGDNQVNQWRLSSGKLRIGVPAGHHTFVVKLADGKTAVWESELVAGKAASHNFVAASAGSQNDASVHPKDGGVSRPIPISVYAGLGATGFFALSAGVTGAMALSKDGEYAELNDGYRYSEAKNAREQTATLGIVSDIAWGATALTAGITAYLYFTRPEKTESVSIHLAPVVDSRTVAFSAFGNF